MTSPLDKALQAAERDWRAMLGEHDRPGLDKFFRTSGFAKQCPREPESKVPDWCGMAVGTWLVEGGLNAGFNTSFLHTLNVEAFFTYGRQRNVNPARLDRQIQMEPGVWVSIEELHRKSDKLRRWLPRDHLPALMGQPDTFRPGDVVLIDWSRRNDADHITMVRSYDGRTLSTWEGNATGKCGDGKVRRDSVVTRTLDLSKAADRELIYGVGRVSDLDLCHNLVR